MRDFLTLDRLPAGTLRELVSAAQVERTERGGPFAGPLEGKSVVLLFEKSSTRTRLSFEIGVRELGGHPVVVHAANSQLGRGEPLNDTARVLNGYAHAVMYRTSDHARLETLAEHMRGPVINGLSDWSHPCQIVADLMTIDGHMGLDSLARVAWVGDCNNVCRSWAHAAAELGFELMIACPVSYRFDEAELRRLDALGAKIRFAETPADAAQGADVVTTDVWSSMGDEAENSARIAAFSTYQVDLKTMRRAAEGACFLHCLPAHRGEEVSAEVIDGPQSIVWEEAANRLHAQKAIMRWCFDEGRAPASKVVS